LAVVPLAEPDLSVAGVSTERNTLETPPPVFREPVESTRSVRLS
jgi:hypothetical protein